jgi:hypothetical protein
LILWKPVPRVAHLAAVLVLLHLRAPAARADIYTYTSPDGTVHFTNLEPRGSHQKPWKKIFKTGPGKAGAVRGPCSQCDAIPAQDRSPERYSRYDQHILEAVDVYQIPEPLVRAVIQVESNYDPRVVSRVGARGLMQLMPSAQKDMHVQNVHDPRENIFGGTRLLRVLANRFDGDLVLTIAAYHAGAGAVRKYGAIPPYETTQLYVRMVLREYYRYKAKLARK